MRRHPVCRPALGRMVTTLALLAVACGGALAKTVNLTDATDRLAAAIQEAGPGGTVHLRGVIRETQSIEIPFRVYLRGITNGGQKPTLIIEPTDRLNGIVVLGSDVQMSNLTIRPSSTLYGNLGTAIFVIGSRFKFHANEVSGWRVGLFLSGADSATVNSNSFAASPLNLHDDYLGAGIYSQFTSGRTDISSNRFHAYYVGIYVQDSAGHMLLSNHIEKSQIGAWMDGAFQSRLTNNIVGGSGIAGLLFTEGASQIDARGNRLSNSAGDSIVAEAGTSGNTIRGNTVDKPVKNFGDNLVSDNRLG